MSALSDAIDHDLRLAILQLLAGEVGFQANVRVLHTAVVGLRFRVSRDKVVTEVAWLREQRLVEVDALPQDVSVVKATVRGREVAQGLVAVPGVSQPEA